MTEKIAKQQYSASVKKIFSSGTQISVRMKLFNTLVESHHHSQVSATNIRKREKLVNPKTDQRYTYIENLPHYHMCFMFLKRKLFKV